MMAVIMHLLYPDHATKEAYDVMPVWGGVEMLQICLMQLSICGLHGGQIIEMVTLEG
jgi:hypothetical protein